MRIKSFTKTNKKLIFREEMPIPLGIPPKASSKAVSRSMRSNVSKDTGPELILRKALYFQGIRGYRLNFKKVPGRPDICFPGLKLAIFINGCFWHRCPKCDLPMPKSNKGFWGKKFTRNKERDKLKKKRLEDMGWKVLTIWECDIKDKLSSVVYDIEKLHKKMKDVDIK